MPVLEHRRLRQRLAPRAPRPAAPWAAPALVFTEATAVAPEGRISPHDLGIWKDEHVEMLARDRRASSTAQGAVPGIAAGARRPQGEHARAVGGRGHGGAEHGGWTPIVAPSAIPFDGGLPDAAGARRRRASRAWSTRSKPRAVRALDAGDAVIEVHAAHGYLLHEFLSPVSNTRTDRYGGSFDNRVRLLRDVVAAVRRVWPEELPSLVRISATDWVDGGWTADESVALARLLAEDGVDLIDCSRAAVFVPNVSRFRSVRDTRCDSPSVSGAKPTSPPRRSG